MSKAALAVLDRMIEENMEIDGYHLKVEALEEARDEIASTCTEFPNNSKEESLEEILESIRSKVTSLEISHNKFHWIAEGYNMYGTHFVSVDETLDGALKNLREKLTN